MTPPIGILGAGPSGLALGRLLEVSGIEYTIFERDESATSGLAQGGTLDLHAGSGLLAVEEAGLLEDFRKLARFDGTNRIADSKGKVVIDLGADGGENSRPEIDRKDLRTLLLKSVPVGRIQWGRRIEKVLKEEDGSMSITLTDGSVESGFKLVVGADGAWSKARSLVTSATPRYSGAHFITSRMKPGNPYHSTAVSMAGKGNFMAFGDMKQLFVMKLGDDSYHTGVGLRLPENWGAENPLSTRRATIEEIVTGWPENYMDIVKHSDEDYRAWPLYEFPTESLSWKSVPGVTLIGDAAHVTTPFQGEGVNTAMFDSVQLAQSIRKYGMDNLNQAVAEYEKEMFPRAIELISGSAKNGEMFFEPDAPKSFLKMFGVEREEESSSTVKA